MSEIEQVTEAVFGDAPIRTGYSGSAQTSFVVAADLKAAMKHGGTTHSYVRGLEAEQEAEDADGLLYTGHETVETPGGPQQMKVIYKRGVFHLLVLSRKKEATKYRNKIFDVLEKIERDGYYISSSITQEKFEQLKGELEAVDHVNGLVFGDYHNEKTKVRILTDENKRLRWRYTLATGEQLN